MKEEVMETTIESALKIISNPSVSEWRKSYWIKVVRNEIAGYKAVNLYNQASLLEKRLNAVTSSAVQQETSSSIR
jgi:hypothetical protein